MFKVGDSSTRPLYECPMCRQSFAEHAGANQCIASHVTPVSIDGFDDIDIQGPETLIVILSNGTKGRYELAEVIENNNTECV